MSRKILIADDEQPVLDLLQSCLQEAGFQVIAVQNGKDALSAFRREHPDLVILDIMMPELDGWETARLLRQESKVPLLFLTARGEDADRISGLEIGADEYLTKPFSPHVLVAYVGALLRRAYGDLSAGSKSWRIGDLELDAGTRLASHGDRQIDLTPAEFDLLAALIAHPGQVFTRMDLLIHIQGTTYVGYERTVDVHVKNLRAKLGDDPREPRYIETVHGVGYRMKPDPE